MRVGLDFDNTIACYDSVFPDISKALGFVSDAWSGTKSELKKYLLLQPDGEYKWQKIQGQVYGKYMQQAQLFPGVANFLYRCKRLNVKIFIISHKTEFGHFDEEKIPLRGAALKWMGINNFFNEKRFNISKESVFFSSTRREKVKNILKLKLDVFVDDLIDVYKEPHFPEDVKKILFSTDSKVGNSINIDYCSNNWSQISEEVFGSPTTEDYLYWAEVIFKRRIVKISELDGRGNSKIHHFTNDSGKGFALKAYPDMLVDSRNRIEAEFNACRFLENTGRVQKAVDLDISLNMAVYEWIDGVKIKKITKDHLADAISFISLLSKRSKMIGPNDFPLASEACLSAKQLFLQIDARLLKLKKRAESFNKLKSFLELDFKPVWLRVKEWANNHWPKNNIETDLESKFRALSPSDFGFHNALQLKDGTIFYLDFEYFGFDDPVKLISDFIWHPGMDLSNDQKTIWVTETTKIFKKTENLENRFLAAWPVFGMKWSLILLNEFLVEGWKKRVHAKQSIKDSYTEKLENQLIQSSAICKFISLNDMRCPHI